MRKVLLVLGIAILCLPMLFVTWLLLASRWQKMDPTTAHAPLYLRQTVASVIMQKAGYSKNSSPAFDRILRLDPDNAIAWRYRCSFPAQSNATPNLKDCETAVKFDHAPADYYFLARAQELSGGDPCVAEETFTHAVTATSSNPQPGYLDGMARTALRCGDISASRVGFEVALATRQTRLTQPKWSQNDLVQIRKNLLADQESLIVIYHRQHEDTLAGQICTAAHPNWKVCSCNIDAKGTASCTEAKSTK
jgi:hypothetical protein